MHDYASLVEPRLGTNIGRWISFSSACRPFGMVNLSPDNLTEGDWGGGYRYSEASIRGFSHVHSWQISGILVMPVVGDVDLSAGPDGWLSPFSHDRETCKPGDHRLHLDRYDIGVELTATLRAGLHRYAFPSGADASIILDLASTLGPCKMGGASLTQTGPRTLEGWVINEPTIRKPKRLTIYFAIELDREVTLDSFDAQAIRTRLRLPAGDAVTMKIAISYTSVAAAWDNLRVETDGKSFDQIRTEAREEWNRWLSRIEVEGGSDDQRGRFYTSLYFSLCGRRTMNDAAGTYIDNTGPEPVVRQIPLDEAGQPQYRHFNSDAFWGAQWSITPLWAIAYPQLVNDFCRCFFDMHQNGGLIPRGPAAGNYTFVMTSAQTTPLYAAALHAGIYKPGDVEAVYQALRKNHFPGGLMSKCGYEHNTCKGGGIEDYIALGYVPEDLPNAGFHNNGGGQTIEHAFNDNALAQVARTLRKEDDAALFTERSKNWRNLFDRSLGFVRPRNRDGSWFEPYAPENRKGWTECNAWTMTFYPTHDLDGLIECFGSSREAMLDRLEEGFKICREKGYFVEHEKHAEIPYDFGNEPALACCHVFQAAGDHRRTQFWLRQILDHLKSGNAPTDNFAGDEDEGLMGAWNVLAAIGLFSIDGAVSNPVRYMITAPVFDKVTVHLDPKYFPGKTFRIVTRNQSPTGELRYIQSAVINNEPMKTLDITHDQIVHGGVLFLDLTDNPSRAHRVHAPATRAEPAPYKIWGERLEAGAIDQMKNAVRLPVAVRGALMPDAHQGYGLPIGGVLATENAVIPYAVGVDIACRMKLSVFDIPAARLKSLHDQLSKALQRETVFGTGAEHRKPLDHPVLKEDWGVTKLTQHVFDKARRQLGTSGSGNHFVEFGILTLDKPDLGLEPGEYLALLSHSGSRGSGAMIADHYSKLAMSLHPELPKELKYLAWLDLDSAEGQEYWAAMSLMGLYASANHALIHQRIARAIGAEVLAGVENHHNFAWKEIHDGRELIVHRKGATPAGAGVLGVIPGSMATPGFVVRGKGNEASLLSASHGAGRAMSRTAARNQFRWAHFKKQFADMGVTLLSAGIDEAPGAYKDIHQVMSHQADLVDVIARFDPKIVKMADAGEKPED